VLKLKEQYAGGRRKPSAAAKSKTRSSAAAATAKKRVDTKVNPDQADTGAARSSNASNEEVEGGADADAKAGAESPPRVPEDDGLDLPAALRRTDDEKQYEAFKARWVKYCQADFAALPAAMQSKFASELLAEAVIATGKGQGAR
jgi:hypothetical protein